MDQRPPARLPRLARLHAFDAVATSGSMRTAAANLHVTQPAITHAIRQLETELRHTLLERTRTGSFLTRNGDILARRARRFAEQLQAAVMALGGDPNHTAEASRRLTETHLRSLAALAQGCGLHAASSLLHVADPTLHRAIRTLETLVRTRLTRRTKDGVALAPAGLEFARRLALAASEIRTGLSELSGGTPSMTLGLLALAPTRVLAEIAERALAHYPDGRVVLIEGSYDSLVTNLRAGTVEAIFGALRAPPPFADLIEETLFDDPYCIVCRASHPLATGSNLKPGDLQNFGWVLPTPALPRRAVLDALLASWGIIQVVSLETNALGAMLSSLLVSDRLGLLPRSYVEGEARSDMLRVLNLTLPHPPRHVGLTTRSDWLPTEIQNNMVQLLRSRLPAYPARNQPDANISPSIAAITAARSSVTATTRRK